MRQRHTCHLSVHVVPAHTQYHIPMCPKPTSHLLPGTAEKPPHHTSCRIFPLGGHIFGECSYRTELSEQKGGAGREPYPSPELTPPGWGRTETAGNAGEGPGLDAEASPATADLLRVKSGEVPEPEIPSVTPPCPSFICSPAMASPMTANAQL